ncbi:MAG: HNH endonuclease [Bacteroidetes bacterium]|nr:HNH endonuclease [Bacteroidota bacterium]
MTTKEIWKDVPGYEGFYQASSLGRIKGLDRLKWNRFKYYIHKGRILKPSLSKNGYLRVQLCLNNKIKYKNIHQIIAITFLNHIPNGRIDVVNHINFNKQDNRVENLEITTTRENSNKKHLKSVSKYIGVGWHKATNKWYASITIKGKNKWLGVYSKEYDAHLAYQKALKEIINKYNNTFKPLKNTKL